MPQYEITLEQSAYGNQVINRWNAIADAIPSGQLGAMLALGSMGFVDVGVIPAFDPASFAGLLQARQHAGVNWVQAVGKNIHDPTDYFAYAFPAGTHSSGLAGQGNSPVVAVGYATDRTRADVRRGQKRFVGIMESDVDDGGYLNTGALAAWQAIGDNMATPVTVTIGGSSVVFTPYVFGRKKTVDSDGKITYPYWPTDAEQLAHSMRINQWTLKNTVRTQTTRQYGRGA